MVNGEGNIVMRNLMFSIVVMLTIATNSMSTENKTITVDGFRGLKWGMTAEEAKKIKKMHMISEDQGGKEILLYSDRDEQMTIGSSQLSHIFYAFWNNQFFAVAVDTEGESNYWGLAKAAREKYKECSIPERYTDEIICNPEGATVELDYNRFSKKGSMTIRSIDYSKKMRILREEAAKKGAATDF